MGSRFVWFVLGVASGMAIMAALRRVREDQEVESVEDITESIRNRLDQFEREYGTAK